MKSLICSDIHDQIKNLENALEVAATSDCNSVIFCGDLCAPFILDIFNENCALPIHIVFGNNDGDKFHMSKKCFEFNKSRNESNAIELHGEFLLKEKGSKLNGVPDEFSIAVYHYPEIARIIHSSGKYDYVFFGHTHKPLLEINDGKLLANPGSLMGYISGNTKEPTKPSCLLIDWNSRSADLIEL